MGDDFNTMSAVGPLPEGAMDAIKVRTKNAATELVQFGLLKGPAKALVNSLAPSCPPTVEKILNQAKGWATGKAKDLVTKAKQFCKSKFAAGFKARWVNTS